VLPKELVGGLLGGETFPDQIAELFADIAGGVVGKDRSSPRSHSFLRLTLCARASGNHEPARPGKPVLQVAAGLHGSPRADQTKDPCRTCRR
jgi:hypothetical protein